MTEILGYIGTALISIAYLPQVIKVIQTKNTEGLSVFMFIILLVANIIWVTYGVLINNPPIIICNGVNFIQSFIIFYFIIKK